jgi:TPR repeat protein
MFFLHHPGFGFVSSNPMLQAELDAYPAYILAYAFSILRNASQARLQLTNVYSSSIGRRQHRALLCRSAVFELLVHKLIYGKGRLGMMKISYHVCSIFSRRHFLVSKNAAETLFEQGQRLYGEQRYREAAESWGQAALLRHGPSHAFLSTMLVEGRQGVRSDEAKAFDFACAGVALDCKHSAGALARCLLVQPGIFPNLRRDDEKCLILAMESATARSPFGLYVLAKCYSHGLGVSKNDAEIMSLFQLAADAGHAESMCEVAHRLRNIGQYPDYQKIASLLHEAAKQGHALAQCNLGLMFKNGELFPIDYQRAMVCFQLAAEQGNSLGRGLLLMIEKKLSKLRR